MTNRVVDGLTGMTRSSVISEQTARSSLASTDLRGLLDAQFKTGSMQRVPLCADLDVLKASSSPFALPRNGLGEGDKWSRFPARDSETTIGYCSVWLTSGPVQSPTCKLVALWHFLVNAIRLAIAVWQQSISSSAVLSRQLLSLSPNDKKSRVPLSNDLASRQALPPPRSRVPQNVAAQRDQRTPPRP